MAQPRIIIIEDWSEQMMGIQLQAILQRENGYRVDLRAGLQPHGTERVDPHPDLIVLVLPVSQERTTHFQTVLLAKGADTPLLLVLRTPDQTRRLDELCCWSTDFLVAPLRETEVRARVQRLLRGRRDQERDKVKEPVNEEVGLAHLIGEDPAFVAVKRKILLMARCEPPVLITGETGTGKKVCARLLHYLSRRAGKPFLPVNCGAIPVELFESELFGHQKGAFTGAWAAKPGLIPEAEGGTLFLDEIDTLSLSAQVKLLHFLEDQTYYALGSPRLKQADVQIIAGTNADLAGRIRDGTFREDLFYRLAVMTLALPPLRERRADIPLLVAHFLALYTDQHEQEMKRLSPRALEALSHYAWPGNIRELQNVMQQVVVLTDAQIIEPEDLPIPPPPPLRGPCDESLKQAKAKVVEHFEKAYLTKLLQVHQGNVTHAARAAKMERRAFGRLIKKYQIAKR